MNWQSFGDTSKEFGRAVTRVLCLVSIYVFTFAWITRPIFIALFPDTLVNVHGDAQVMAAIFLWIVIFIFHIGAFAYATGIVITNRDWIKDRAKRLYERIQHDRPGTD